MESFKEYYKRQDEGTVGRFIKGVFNSEYRALSPKMKRYYDMMNPEAKKAIEEIRTGLQIPLANAIMKYIDEYEARNQWKNYNKMVPPERTAYGVKSYGQDTTGWKRFS